MECTTLAKSGHNPRFAEKTDTRTRAHPGQPSRPVRLAADSRSRTNRTTDIGVNGNLVPLGKSQPTPLEAEPQEWTETVLDSRPEQSRFKLLVTTSVERTLLGMDYTEAFTACWHRDAPRVVAYATRHTNATEAADVVAETFMVAWRRWEDVPDPAIGWLIRTAAGVIRNKNRSARRHQSLVARVALLNFAASAVGDTSDGVAHRDEALRRLASLSDDQREALLLVAWDGLTNEEAATVLGLKPPAFRKRLSRARELLDRDEPPPRAPHRPPHAPTPLTAHQEMT